MSEGEDEWENVEGTYTYTYVYLYIGITPQHVLDTAILHIKHTLHTIYCKHVTCYSLVIVFFFSFFSFGGGVVLMERGARESVSNKYRMRKSFSDLWGRRMGGGGERRGSETRRGRGSVGCRENVLCHILTLQLTVLKEEEKQKVKRIRRIGEYD